MIPQNANKSIVIGIENNGSKPNKDQSQNDENIDNIKCSPWAKFTISIKPKIKLKPAAINAYINPIINPVTIAWIIISDVIFLINNGYIFNVYIK